MAAYFSVLQPGDRILGMNLAHGGHLTHGMAAQLLAAGCTRSTPTASARTTERIDYDALEAQAQRGPAEADRRRRRAYPRIWDFERMAAIAHGVGALLFVDMAHIAGLVAAGRPPEPVPARRHRHDDDPQDAARPARRADLQPRRAARRRVDRGRLPDGQGARSPRPIDKTVFPGVQGGPLMHVIAGKAVALQAGRRATTFRDDQRRTVENAAVLAETLAEQRRAGRLGRHGQPPHARRRDAARA